MTAESVLSSLVEAAIGMAGFAGIIAAVRQRGIADWPYGHRLLLRMLLIASAATICFALLPAVLAEAQVPKETIWRICSAALLVWQLIIAVYRTRQFRARATPPPSSRALQAWVAAILLMQLANLYFGVSWLYLLGVFGVLGNAFTFFMLLLLGERNPSEPTA